MAAIMLLMFRSEVDKFYRAVDWDLIGFFMGLFVVIYVMEHAQVLSWIGDQLQSVMKNVRAEVATPGDATTLLVGSAFFSSVTDNIPLSAMLASILKQLARPIHRDCGGASFWCQPGRKPHPHRSASTLVAVTIHASAQSKDDVPSFREVCFTLCHRSDSVGHSVRRVRRTLFADRMTLEQVKTNVRTLNCDMCVLAA